MNPNDIKIPDYNLDADKEAKEKMMIQMSNDIFYLPVFEYLSDVAIDSICDELIRKGWRKVNHIAEAGKMSKCSYIDHMEEWKKRHTAGYEDGLEKAQRMIEDDAYAVSFQSMGKYRSALINSLEKLRS